MKKISAQLKTKSDLIKKLSQNKKLSLNLSSLCVNIIQNEITQALLNDEVIELRGFGSFGVKKYKAYKGRNPQNQKQLMVPSKKRPWFKAYIFTKKIKTS